MCDNLHWKYTNIGTNSNLQLLPGTLLSIQLVDNEELITSYNFTVKKQTIKIGSVKTCVNKLMYIKLITLFLKFPKTRKHLLSYCNETFLLMKKYPEVNSVLVFLNVLIFVSIIYTIIHFDKEGRGKKMTIEGTIRS